MTLYRLYGLTVESEFSLPAPVAEARPIDVVVRWGPERSVPVDPPRGEVMSRVDLGVFKYSTTRTKDGFVMRYPPVCDAVVDEALERVKLIPASSEQRPVAELLFSGNVLANLLTLRGECVLHASAVTNNGRAIGFIGPPGRGKSTLAALTCAVGGQLITDDVLRLTRGTDGWWCPTGTGIIRLRPKAESIAPLLEGSIWKTIDERMGVSFEMKDARFPVAALVFPLPSKIRSKVEVTRLTEQDALMRLTSFPRVLGWKDPDVLARSFRMNARVAREIPTYEAVIPWGPPFDPGTVLELVGQLDTRSQKTP